jgi:hypothetical protein
VALNAIALSRSCVASLQGHVWVPPVLALTYVCFTLVPIVNNVYVYLTFVPILNYVWESRVSVCSGDTCPYIEPRVTYTHILRYIGETLVPILSSV